MAKKRSIRVENPPPPPPRGELPEKYKDSSWREWVRAVYLKHWYVLGCLFLDAVVTLELFQRTSSAVIAVIFLIGVSIIEILVYQRLWPDKNDL